MSKKNYMSLLKEAIAEFDTSDTVEVKGPMLDPIISWDGDGELPTSKDAASVLERYYFNETKNDNMVDALEEADYENDNGNPASGKSMKNAKGAGTEQAGTSDAATIPASKKEKEKDIAKEDVEVEDTDMAIEEDVDLETENAIIEKLIAEMEDEGDDDDDEDEEEEEDKKEKIKEEKKAKGPEEDAKGAGTEQAGTGDAEGEIPPRKDMHDKFVKPKNYSENEEIEAALEALEQELMSEADDMEDEVEADDEVEKDLDVDKEVAEESAVPGGPHSLKNRGEDDESDESVYSEAFEIFKDVLTDEE